MQDIPFYETEYGTAGLVLNQVRCTGSAFIHILQIQQTQRLLMECIGFCRAVGAERIYACGTEELRKYPHYTDVLKMCCPLDALDDTAACLFPVTEETVEHWRQIYNERMSGVDNAAILSEYAARKLVKDGGAYFVHNEDHLLGIGVAFGEDIQAVVSVKPGQGRQVLLALCHALTGPMVNVEVASTNNRAVRLYEAMGFTKTGVVRSWYQVV